MIKASNFEGLIMEIKGFTRIINELPSLTDNQIRLIRDRADSIIHKDSTAKLIDQCKSSDEVACPYCGSIKLNKWGMSAGLQRYRCKEQQCRKTFNALTKTPLARLRKRSLWSQYVECIADSKTIRQSARELGVAITTVFRWRHRFLASPTVNKVSEVSGIVEADEMFFLESYKGKRTIHHREPRKRGGMGDKRKKEDQIAVLIVKERSGGLTETMLGRPNKEKIGKALKPIINTDSILCSDGAHSYRSFAKENGLTHYRTIASKSQRVIGKQFHIQNVNNYMMRIRVWMQRFYGVGTDYLPNYLGWMRLMESVKNRDLSLADFISDAFSFPHNQQKFEVVSC